jgi:hypothetical protein
MRIPWEFKKSCSCLTSGSVIPSLRFLVKAWIATLPLAMTEGRVLKVEVNVG